MTLNERARETTAVPTAATPGGETADATDNAPAAVPGCLVLVVGPSGAGKDALLDAARAACAGDGGISFVRRGVTRQPSVAEDHASFTEAEFEKALADGAFSFWWEAHGLKYGVPVSIEADLAAGLTVVCNVSRHIVAGLRARYPQCCVVLITAPEEVRMARLARRQRASDGNPVTRANRAAPGTEELRPALVIDNTGTVAEGTAALLAFLRRPWF
jgi:phosphonate metabolism protein PhnN/1,5-bisphosphokinase (PRPP-forming)